MHQHTTVLSISAVAALAMACSVPNADYCESHADCGESALCDVTTQSCRERNGDLDDTSTDAGLAACEGQCIEPLEGWIGPVVRHDAAANVTLPDCSGDFPTTVFDGFFDLHSEGSCDCQCSAATELSCSDAGLSEWNNSDSNCELNICPIVGGGGGGGGGCMTGDFATVGFGECTTIPSYVRGGGVLKASFGVLQGGSCAPATTGSNFAAAFASHTRICAAAGPSGDCETGETCAPEEAGLCIFRVGEHDCPEDTAYTERLVRYSGFSDSRECAQGSCVCSPPTGTCGGAVHLMGGASPCAQTLETLHPTTSPLENDANLCEPAAGALTHARYEADLDNRSCQASGSPGETGEVVGTGAVTLCCAP